ncbi:MAG: cyclase family protein [Bacillota bacterium]|jgi:kynurenine formamidase|nr:cyclase family protein [Bacillota bacterium]MDD3297922.1 cyclase family protein [Bacillota bacterium]MDD3850580.1 cyclase family protein [Bacillota bacterium]MDD4707368.1 cyclase family protein [Bacillota bacterium]
MKVVDLTHTIHPDTPVFPGTEQPIFSRANTIERDGFRETKITMYSHTGTHIDAPAHMLDGGLSLDSINIEGFIGKAVILDFSNLKSGLIDIDDIKPWEKKIQRALFVIIKTGWSKYWGQDKYYGGFPSLSREAAGWLAGFNLKGIGVDAISIDDMDSTTFDVHKTLLSNNILIIENLTNLDAVENEYFTLCVMPLKTKDSDGSPVRAAAIEDL